MRNRIIGLIFAEKTVTSNTYMDMFQLYAVSVLPNGTIYHEDGASPHFSNIVCAFLEDRSVKDNSTNMDYQITRPNTN